MDGAREVRAARGTTLTAGSWQTEAPLRMLMNNLDPEVAERPDDLVVYGGTGRAARSWGAFDAMVATLRTLADDETMLVQSGKPVGVMRTHEWAPRVLIANSNLVGDWATWPEFRRLEHLGLTMYGQMTAGSWIYIGTQGILQGTYETFAAVAAKRFGGTLAGTLTVTGGCGGMGGAQPLSVTLNDGVCLVIDVDETRLRRRVEHRYLDVVADGLTDAIARCGKAKAARTPLSVGLVGNCATVLPELLRLGVAVDIVTDQTSAHDPLSYLPEGVDLDDWQDYAAAKPEEFTDRARTSMAKHVEAMVGFMDAGSEVFDYGNSATRPDRADFPRHSRFPGSSRPTSGRCSARAKARSGGRRCPAIRKTFTPPTRPCWTSFPTTSICIAGSAPRRTRWRFRVCRPAFAGWATANATRPGCDSTTWSRPASCPLRWSSVAITWTAARSRPRTARPRRWPTARMRSLTGRCSTLWSTPRPVPVGCPFIMAAAWASGDPFMPARSAWLMAPRWRARRSNGC
jgi:hypothetical protein